MKVIFTMRLIVLLFFFLYFDRGGCADERVLLRDVSTITLRDGQYTTGRRSAPVPQLKCVGGGARGRFKPRAVQCVKQGFDGMDYQWKCSADMPQEYEFGQVTVTCEGYSYPEDPYILKGSCGLEYDLEYADTAYARKDVSRSRTKSSWWSWFTHENIANAVVALFILYVMYSMFFANTTREGPRTPPRYGWFGGGFDGGPGYPGGHPPPSAPPPPPSYEDTMGYKSAYHSAPSSSGSGPGFWTGAGLGALGGYLFGRNAAPSAPSYGFAQAQPTVNERFMRDTGFDDSHADQPSTSEMHESTGYGGTRRR
ncbi:hypothetical protein Y032_0001g19 [Ancylostoma ceylanicum]|uniref:Store-operated calcium entry-associated regulatory factor n=2 Tax=Ancylostoma ceylanicum TaxID=53326 RepID=A0A016W3X3_9BILA|nr:hypothetical protein Y032_0001g19 [Ancylostoma ceylanicum]